MAPSAEIRIVDGNAELFQSAATEFAALAGTAVRSRGRFCVALSGGSTPRGLYSLLASAEAPFVPWDSVCFFWGDERHVPPNHPESNYRMASEVLLSKVPLRRENVFRIPAEEKDAGAAALSYEDTLRTFFGEPPDAVPRFDLILLGLGPEGHIASLFPGSAALLEQHRLVVANWVEKLKTDRITFTLPLINRAGCVMFLVSGAEKAEVVREVLENPGEELPAQRVHPLDGRLVWLVDRDAAGALQEKRS